MKERYGKLVYQRSGILELYWSKLARRNYFISVIQKTRREGKNDKRRVHQMETARLGRTKDA